MPLVPPPTHDDVLAVLAGILRSMDLEPEGLLGSPAASRVAAARLAERACMAGRSREHPAIAVASHWLQAGRTREAAADTARLAATTVRLLRDAGRAAGEAAGWVPEGADLRMVRLFGEDLRGLRLVRAVLDDASLHGADLSGAVLSGARLDRSDLGGTRLWDARLDGAAGVDVLLDHVDAHRCDFRGSHFTRARMCLSSFTGCRWTEATLDAAEIGPTLIERSDPPDRSPRIPRPRFTVRGWPRLPTMQHGSWSPDGAILATSRGCEPGVATMIDAATGALRRVAEHRESRDRAPSWDERSEAAKRALLVREDPLTSPSGRAFVIPSADDTTRVVRGPEDEVVLLLPKLAHHCVAWSPHEDRIASIVGHSLRIWDVDTGAILVNLSEACIAPTMAWSPDGSRIAIIAPSHSRPGGHIRILDARDGSVLVDMQEVLRGLRGLAWSPRGDRIAASVFGCIMSFWNALDGSLQLTLPVQHLPRGAVWSPDGEMLVVETPHAIQLWDPALGTPVATFATTRGLRTRAQWSCDGHTLVTQHDGGIVRLWDVHQGALLRTLVAPEHDRGSTHASPDGRRIAQVERRTLWIHETDHGTLQLELEAPGHIIEDVAWSPNGSRIAYRGPQETAVWDAATGRRLQAFVLDPCTGCRRLESLAWSPDGKRIALGSELYVMVLDVATGDVLTIRTKGGHAEITWSPDGEQLAQASWNVIALWSARDGSLVRTLTLPRATDPSAELIDSIAWSPCGDVLVSVSTEGTVRLWSIDEGTTRVSIPMTRVHPQMRVAWSPDGKRLAISGAEVSLWDVDSGQRVAELYADGDAWVVSVAGGGFRHGSACPRLVLEVEHDGELAYLPAAGVVEHARPELVAAALAGEPPASVAEALGWPPAEPWDGRIHRLDWSDAPRDRTPAKP